MLWKILLISSYKHACKTSLWMEKEEWGRNSRTDGPSQLMIKNWPLKYITILSIESLV
jgi:hypothetical protein